MLSLPVSNSRKVRWLTVACLAWTLAAATYAALRLNFERAPVVHVRWAQFVDDSSRARLQMRFGLAAAQYDSGTTWVYFLMSPATENIQALVESPAVEDTHHIDRVKFVVSPGAARRGPYIPTGRSWIPLALQRFIAFLAAAGVMALIFANAPTIRRALPGLRAMLVAAWPLYVVCGALVALWVFYFIQLREGAKEAAPFRVGDWLVSYQAGFVRRGLPGSPILALTTLVGAAPERIVLWIQTVLYTVLFGLLFLLVRRKRLNIWFLAFLFSPAGLLFPLYDPAVIGRKDVLFMVVVALYAWWMPAPERRRARVATCALGAATTLAHELFFFFTPYFFLMRLLREKRTTVSRFAPELWLFGGSLVALLAVSIFGANLHGDAQCAELLRRGFNEQLCDGILRYPVTTIRESMAEVAGTIDSEDYLPAYPIAAVLAALPLIPALVTLRSQLTRSFVVGSVIAVSFTLPMFVIVQDWGRLLNIHVVALAVVMAAFLVEERSGTRTLSSSGRGSWRWAAILLGVFLYLTTWSIGHCCRDPFRAGIFEPE